MARPASNKQEEIEYKGFTIISEQDGRVVVAERGLYVAEFADIDKAKEYIDGQ